MGKINEMQRKFKTDKKGKVICMSKFFKKGLKSVGCLMLALALVLNGGIFFGIGNNDSGVMVAKAATVSNRVPLWCYMQSSSGKAYTYTTSSLSTRTGYIEPGDYCKILSFYSNGAVKVSYPTSKGTRTAYAAASSFFGNVNFSTATRTLGARLTTYRRSTGGSTIGTVFASDQVTIICHGNGRTQLLYPCAGGYKVGWVSGTYSIGSNPKGCIDLVSSPSSGKLRVAGWVFDPDATGTAAQVHVYVGGAAGSGAPGWAITCNGSRPDVHNVYRCGNNHGFDVTFSPGRTGSQTVYFYAINIGGGENVYLGCRTVSIGGGNNTGVQVSLNVPNYKQYNYPNTYIGTKTIKAIGCTLTSCAMAYSYNTGTNTTPDIMRNKLKFSNNDLIWSSLNNVGLSYSGNYNCKINNSIMSTIYSKLKSGRPVIIGGKSSSGGQHWVLVKGYTGNSSTSFSSSSFTINDPNSTSRTTLAQFLNAYPTVQRLIY